MFLGGVQKSSLIDYPGKVSCVLFFSGCNFTCPYCHNPSLVTGEGPQIPLSITGEFSEFLGSRRGFLDGVVLSGGEPTLQEDLVPLCLEIKKQGYSIKLDTNGSMPSVLTGLIKRGLVDYIAMDIKTDLPQYERFIQKGLDTDRILSSIRTIMQSGVDYEFRTTCVRPIVDEQIMENVARIIGGARLYALQSCSETTVLHPEFFSSGMDTRKDLSRLREIASPWVKECIIRRPLIRSCM
jgi:pyruvate formate lyase activating enzyme